MCHGLKELTAASPACNFHCQLSVCMPFVSAEDDCQEILPPPARVARSPGIGTGDWGLGTWDGERACAVLCV